MNKGFIYKLIDPSSNEIRYIGQTIQKLKYRLGCHIYHAKHRNYYVCSWIKGLLSKNIKPCIELICEVDRSDLDKFETYYIELYKNSGCRLTNLDLGGQKTKEMCAETRFKIWESKRGYKKYSRDVVDKVLNEYKDSNIRIADISLKYGIHPSTIGIWVKENNIKLRGAKNKYMPKIMSNSKTRKFLNDLIIDYSNKEISVKEISIKYGINKTTISRVMKRNNISLRDYSLNKDILYDLKINKKMTIEGIADYFKCSKTCVKNYTRKYKILENATR